jgi:hypothetical protein
MAAVTGVFGSSVTPKGDSYYQVVDLEEIQNGLFGMRASLAEPG